MPVRWTAETDQILLLKILETSAVSVDVKKVSQAWPSNLEIPTPRAISERLVRIRSLAKSANGTSAHFAVANVRASTTPKSSPQKTATPQKIVKSKPTPKSTPKRKRGGRMSSEESNDEGVEAMEDLGSESEDVETPVKKKKFNGAKVKIEQVDAGGEGEGLSAEMNEEQEERGETVGMGMEAGEAEMVEEVWA